MGSFFSEPCLGEMINDDVEWHVLSDILRSRYGEQSEPGVSMAAAIYAISDDKFMIRRKDYKDKIPWDLIKSINERNTRGTYNRLDIFELEKKYKLRIVNHLYMDEDDRIWVPIPHMHYCYQLSLLEESATVEPELHSMPVVHIDAVWREETHPTMGLDGIQQLFSTKYPLMIQSKLRF